MSLGTILLIVLVIVLLGGFSGFGGGPFYGTGYYGGGGLGRIVVIVLILVLLGKLYNRDPLCGGSHERDLRDHLCCRVGCSRDHPVLRCRNVDNAREHEAGLSGSDCSDRNLVGDRSAAGLCSAAGITCWTVIAELPEQSQHRPVKKPFVCLKRSSWWSGMDFLLP